MLDDGFPVRLGGTDESVGADPIGVLLDGSALWDREGVGGVDGVEALGIDVSCGMDACDVISGVCGVEGSEPGIAPGV